MSLSLQATIFSGSDLSIKGTYPLFTYDIQMDALSNVSSTYTVVKNEKIAIGDFIAVRESQKTRLMYYGQITTIDTDDQSDIMTLTANYLWNVLNGDIIVGGISGNSYEAHVIKLINKYIASNLSTNILHYSLSNSTNTSFSVSNTDGITTSNFIDYLIRGFKLHNTVFDVVGIGEGNSNGKHFYYPQVNIHQIKDLWNFKNDVYDFNNWTVTDSRHLRGYNNELWIVDQASKDMENPTVLGRYWLQEDAGVTKTLNDKVNLPTQVQIYLFDKTATDNPTYDSIASNNLSGNTYSHSIQFSALLENSFLPLDKVKLGLQSNIYYNGTIYKSILTAYSISNDSDVINLTFGNLRFGKKDLFGTDI